MTAVLAAVTTSLLAILAVSLWTLRVALTARNHKLLAAVAASAEATIFALAFSRLLASLDSVSQVIAYTVGVGVGTLAGLAINERLTRATRPPAGLTVIATTNGSEHAPLGTNRPDITPLRLVRLDSRLTRQQLEQLAVHTDVIHVPAGEVVARAGMYANNS